MPSPTLYDKYAAHLFALALRITGDDAAAAEIISSAFLTLGDDADEASLVRATRDAALARRGRAAVATSGPPTPLTAPLLGQASRTPRQRSRVRRGPAQPQTQLPSSSLNLLLDSPVLPLL